MCMIPTKNDPLFESIVRPSHKEATLKELSLAIGHGLALCAAERQGESALCQHRCGYTGLEVAFLSRPIKGEAPLTRVRTQ